MGDQSSVILQLYELSDDLKRKEWLDDWLNFMHRIGTSQRMFAFELTS